MVQIRMQRLAAQYQVNFMFTPMPLADHEHLRNRAKFSWEQALVAGGLTATSPLHRMLPPIDRTTDEQGHQPKALPLYLQSAELYMKLLKAYPKARLAVCEMSVRFVTLSPPHAGRARAGGGAAAHRSGRSESFVIGQKLHFALETSRLTLCSDFVSRGSAQKGEGEA